MAFLEIHLTGSLKAEISSNGFLVVTEGDDQFGQSRVAMSGLGESKAERIAAIINEVEEPTDEQLHAEMEAAE